MAYLINRAAAARMECLHAVTQLIKEKFNMRPFAMKDIKFRKNVVNVHEFCRLLKPSDIYGSFCPFKDNPLDEAGCAMTNGVDSDSTKSKEVSNTVNALHALGFVRRSGNSIVLTPFGEEFAATPYDSAEMTAIIRRAVVNYGPIVGILAQLREMPGDGFSVSDLTVGYPATSEYVAYKGNVVEVSGGSKTDSNIRTKSCLLAWLTTAGYIRPSGVAEDTAALPQLRYRRFINSAQRNAQNYEIIELPELGTTLNPLDYKNLTKMNGSLREKGMADVRGATLEYEARIKNRRFAIIYLLNKAYNEHKLLPFRKIVDVFEESPEMFLLSKDDVNEMVEKELDITILAGLPYVRVGDGGLLLKPQNGINMEEASKNAPLYLLSLLSGVKIDG